jgi:hypothetical protein
LLLNPSGGNVGIGSTPVVPLDVRGADNVVIGATPSSGNGEGSIFLSCIGTGTKGNIIARETLSFQITSSSTPVTSGTERARIDSSGRLLVGTSSDRSSAGVNGRFQLEGNSYNTSSVNLINNGNDNQPSYLVFGKSRSGSVGGTTIVQSGDYLGRIDFAGADGSSLNSVGAFIGCQVDGTPGSNDMPGRLVFSTTADGASSSTERMRITNGGQVDIGGSYAAGSDRIRLNPSASNFSRNTTGAAAQIYFENPNGTVGQISTSGFATSYLTSSDYRLKENVTQVTDGIARFKQLKPSRFNFIADPGHTVDGFLAHEAQAVVPECVTGEKDAVDDDGNPVYQGIDQAKLVPLLTAALQEAIAKIETLEARLTAAGIE